MYSHSSLYQFMQSILAEPGTHSYEKPASNAMFEINHDVQIQFVEAIKTERISRTLPHQRAPCEAISEMDSVLKHSFSAENW